MAKTAVALYDTENEAQQVVNELSDIGFSRSSMRMMDDNDSDVITTLTNAGLPHSDASAYFEGMRRGGHLVMITTEDDEIDRAVDIMDRYNSVNIQERAEMWRSEGWNTQSDWDANNSGRQATLSGTQGRSGALHEHGQEEATIPVVEEKLRVGKRQVESGGVRVRTHIEEKPVEETVNLREEHVNVERRPVNRTATPTDFDTFEEGTLEFSELEEEAVVDKQARVVEEVVVKKESRERQQKVRDTVRRTDVDVERIDGDDEVHNDFASYSTNFRNHYNTNYANSGMDYAAYEPAYEYGYTLRNRANLRGRSWADIEAQARTDWERDHGSTWERFKAAVRHGWESVTS